MTKKTTNAIPLIINKEKDCKANGELHASLSDAKIIGDVIEDILSSDSEFAIAQRERKERFDCTGRYHNTELCVDVKTLLIIDRVMQTGKRYNGFFTKDSEGHITLVEKAKQTYFRYDKKFDGELISLTQRDDGTFRSHFKDFAISPTLTEKEVRKLGNKLKREFVDALLGLVEKKEVAR